MDFLRYAEASAGLLNTEIVDVDDLVGHLSGREWLQPQVTDRDCMLLRRFQRELRPVFEASDAGDTRGVIDGLNALMVRHPITPRISDHDGDDLHLHVATKSASVAELVVGESLLGLATLVCDLGPTRLGVCSAERCEQRLRGHLPEPVAPLLLRPVLLAGERRGVPPPAEDGGRARRDRSAGARRGHGGRRRLTRAGLRGARPGAALPRARRLAR